MTRRPHPKYASNDAHDGPWTVCDRCGFNWSQNRMAWQFDYRGGSTPQKTGFLHCPRCMDGLNFQQKLVIIPPDPPPFFNTRPEPYAVDETNWLTTESGDILTTESGVELITNIPNPEDVANTTWLSATLAATDVSVLYLDLFDGDPAAGGFSILAAVTGSATRTDIAAEVESNGAGSAAFNPEDIAVAAAALDTVNVTHIAFYSAAAGGIRLISGAVSTAYPTIVAGAAVSILSGALVFTLS